MNFIKYICLILLIQQCLTQTVKVTTKYGDIVGSIDKSTSNRVFLGIPYAKPPVGSLRFKPPQSPDSWAPKSLDALKISPICIQAYDTYISEDLLKTQSEDCLYLNVWAPQNTIEPLAVMVWIHGGTLKTGGTAEPYYTGNNLAKYGNVVVVSINYRLGILGFLSSDMLSKEDPNWPTSGNYGLLDQNLALKWVKDNIQAFGGDPNKVTIFGESAGAYSVCFHLLMPMSKGLFQRAILQSNSCSYPMIKDESKRANKMLFAVDPTSAKSKSAGYISGLKCSDTTCLRSKSADEIKIFQYSFKTDFLLWAYIDGVVLPDDPAILFKNGNYNKVDIIIGHTLNEGTFFGMNFPSYKEFNQFLTFAFPLHNTQVANFYPQSEYKSANDAYIQLSTDFDFMCPTRSLAKYISSNGGSAYVYLFASVPSFLSSQDKITYGAFHMAEILYVFNYPFGFFLNKNNSPFTQDEILLSNQMMDFWVSFAKNGVPTSSNTNVKWEKFTTADTNYMRFDVKSLSLQKNLKNEICDLYELTVSTINNSGSYIVMPSLFFALFMIFELLF